VTTGRQGTALSPTTEKVSGESPAFSVVGRRSAFDLSGDADSDRSRGWSWRHSALRRLCTSASPAPRRAIPGRFGGPRRPPAASPERLSFLRAPRRRRADCRTWTKRSQRRRVLTLGPQAAMPVSVRLSGPQRVPAVSKFGYCSSACADKGFASRIHVSVCPAGVAGTRVRWPDGADRGARLDPLRAIPGAGRPRLGHSALAHPVRRRRTPLVLFTPIYGIPSVE
jgi:hypothetical protein